MIKPEGWARLAVGESDWYTATPEWEINFNRLREHVRDAISAAINDKLEEVALELIKLEEGVYTSAQTPSGLVRAMKVR